MKHFTLILSAALVAASATAQSVHLKRMLRANFSAKPSVMNVLKGQTRAARGADDKMAPSEVALYNYQNGGWVLETAATYSYTREGKVKESVKEVDGMLTKTQYEYDRYGNNTAVTVLVDEGGTGDYYDPTERTVSTFDDVCTSFMTSQVHEMCYGSDWIFLEGVKAPLQRNADGNVTSIVTSESNGGDYNETKRFFYTYDAATKQAVEASTQYGNRNELTGKVEWEAPLTYKNVTWKKTNGQFTNDIEYCLDGENMLLSADCYEGKTLYLTIRVTYADNGDVVQKYEGKSFVGTMEYSITTLDENGSYEEKLIRNIDRDGNGIVSSAEKETIRYVYMFDNYGNLTLQEIYYGTGGFGDGMLQQGEKVEYKRDAAADAVSEAIHYYYQKGETVAYTPMYKMTYGNFVSTGIQSAQTGSAAAVVYDLQGRMVGDSLNGLPSGIYLVKEGDSVKKVIKQ